MPAVDAVCEALTRPGGGFRLTGACRRFGEERAGDLMSLEETRDDLGVLARLQEPHRMAAMLDAVTVGWVEAQTARWGATEVVEPMDGFNSLMYLRARLDEVYAEAAMTGDDVDVRWGVVVLETRVPRNGMARHLVHETLHEALRFAFPGGESRVTLRPGRIGALVGRAEPRLSESLAVLRSELARANETGQLHTVSTKLVGLPAQREDLVYLLEDLAL